jgi:hypothetical protein
MDLFVSGKGQVRGFCEHGGDKHPGSIKSEKSLGYLRSYTLLKTFSSPEVSWRLTLETTCDTDKKSGRVAGEERVIMFKLYRPNCLALLVPHQISKL